MAGRSGDLSAVGPVMGEPDLEAVRQWLVASCEAQGVPVQITDAVLVAKLGVLLGASGEAARGTAGAAPPARSA
ncbi:hypothetical protein OVA14_12730 [Agrococcus sp. SL85]|uniref:hypothetical protein n=1 Tax=Agrococcus sp. SL85 TaxID=2995141 RepID=UPI00226C7E06|nr:hypothetical protein [Agrococcus sp. SL85]WAC66130.1 hypothetical protein OVA14_12730 [Agrococcus sp. SL85]